MRQLHPVSIHEKFAASGIYRFFIELHQLDVVEYWSIHELPDKSQIIRVDRDDRVSSGSSLLIEALRNPIGGIERLDFHAYGDPCGINQAQVVRSKYLFFEDSVHIGRTVNNQVDHHAEMMLPSDYIVCLTALSLGDIPALFLGFGIAQATTKSGMEVDAFTPMHLFDEQEPYGEILKLGVLYNGEGVIASAGKSYHVRGYGLIGMKPIRTFWLDDYDVLIKFESSSDFPIVSLTQYARRVEPKAT